MRIDFHTHVLHPKIADKVLAHLEEYYALKPLGSGLIEDILARAKRAGLDRIVALTAATAPSQVIPANDWSISLKKAHPEVIAFGTMHPGYTEWEAELERLKAAGIRGIKFHPECQGYRMDDPGLDVILEAGEKDFLFLFHVGDKTAPELNPSCPFKLAKLMHNHPKANFAAAHLGGYMHWKWALEVLIGKNVCIDTSSSLPFIDDDALHEIFRRHPRERIFFGSDYPLFDPGEEIELLRTRLKLSAVEIEELLTNAGQWVG